MFQFLKFGWKIAKGDIGAGVVVVAMGEMRLEVIIDGGIQRRGVAVPRQASISDGGGNSVDGVGRAVVSLQGLWAVCYLCVR